MCIRVLVCVHGARWSCHEHFIASGAFIRSKRSELGRSRMKAGASRTRVTMDLAGRKPAGGGERGGEEGSPFSQWGMHLFRSRVFIVLPATVREGRLEGGRLGGSTENGRRNFDNIQRQRQVRRSSGAAEDGHLLPPSPLHCVLN